MECLPLYVNVGVVSCLEVVDCVAEEFDRTAVMSCDEGLSRL